MNDNVQTLFDPQRATRLMTEAGLDLILASRRHTVAYLSDRFAILYWEYPEVAHCLEKEDDGCAMPYYFAGIARDPRVGPFVVAHSNRAGIWHDGWITDIKESCDKPGKLTAVDQIVKAVEERGLGGGTIGVEMNHIPAGVFKQLETRLPHATFKNATPALWKMRMVKTEREISRQREAYRIAERIYGEVIRVVGEKPGITVGEVRGIQMAMAAEAGCPPIHFGYVFPQDGKTKFPWQTGDPRVRMEAGDVVLLDLGVIYKGYTTDFGRGVVLGRAPKAIKDTYDRTLELRRVISSAIKPGVRACDLHAIGTEYCAKVGWGESWALGHGLGIECHEPPQLASDDETVLEEGMTIVIELVTSIERICFLLEDAGLVTSQGWESLTKMSPELVELY